MDQPTNSDMQALIRQHLPAFVEKTFEFLHPGQTLKDTWHIHAICYELSQIFSGEERRLMINVPPRTLKSMIVSVAFPAFVLGHFPSKQIMVVSHNFDLATDLSAKFRKLVESGWYKAAFPTMSGAPDKDNERIFVTFQGGRRAAVSVNGSVTGFGSDIIIIDDPLDASEAASQTACEKVNYWIDKSLSTRFNDGPKSSMILLMQRLSIHDPSAHLAQQEPWKKLILPAISDADMEVQIGPSQHHFFAKGTLLDPNRLPQSFLDGQRVKMGEAAYLAQYLQRPVPGGGGEIDVSLFQRYKTVPKEYDARFLSVDAASGSQSGSYSVVQLYQITDGKLYMCNSWRGFWKFPYLVKFVIEAQKSTKADFIVIEKASSGLALLEDLWERYSPEIRQKLLQPWIPKHSKEVRMAKAMVLVEARKISLPESSEWLPPLISELQEFPMGENDDQVDALSQAVDFFRKFQTSAYNPSYKGSGRVIATW